ncbi:MAG: type 2 isopentenyl-diphosphate Delta-isomerase, partial [Proteobacteria bacterium]|nr:type 2 isopentenyl-diphosphate Delta-isomerase [Pseudomonadota bacterium]
DHQKILYHLSEQIRKRDHLVICQDVDDSNTDSHGFSKWQFMPRTISALDFDTISTKQTFLGHVFDAPLFVTAMTGGIELGSMINRVIAKACHQFRIPMSVGSQRIALEQINFAEQFMVKDHFPDLFLIGNIGISALASSSYLDQVKRSIAMIKADALGIHCNLLQELIQPEGHRDYKMIWHHLERCVKEIQIPILVKEVGCGMDVITATRLAAIGVKVIDVGGMGGVSWSVVEGRRAADLSRKNLGSLFQSWGLSTAQSLMALKQASLGVSLTATGGIRDGLTVAKALVLGADMVGVGMPVLKACLADIAQQTKANPKDIEVDKELIDGIKIDHLESFFSEIIHGLKITQMLTESQSIADLKKSNLFQVEG